MTDITAVSSAAPISSAGQITNQQFSTDLFLQLLVTQLRYQDPMSGSQDTGELITQLTMFTMLEQVVKLQQTVDEQAHYLGNQQALNMLNRQVEVIGPDGALISGEATAVDLRSTGARITVGDFDYPLSAVIRVEGGSRDNG